MADPSNPSFEDAGINLGQADSWTEAYSDGNEDIAEFGAGPRDRPYEGFIGGWSDNHLAQLAFVATDLTAALFEALSLAYESFEYSWVSPGVGTTPLNHQSVWAFQEGNFTMAEFDAANEEFEDFEEEWNSNENAQDVFAGGDLTVAGFDNYPYYSPEDVEDFEEAWQYNENTQTVFSGGDLTAALFDSGTNAFEDFEGSWTSVLP